MQKNKLSLGAFMKAVSQAVSDANQKLLEDSDRAEGSYAPHALCIGRMRVSFSAHVTRSDRSLRDTDAAELMLDFDRSNPNFHSEMHFLPSAQGAEPGEEDEPAEYGSPDAGPDEGPPAWTWEAQNDAAKPAVRPLEGIGGNDNGNR